MSEEEKKVSANDQLDGYYVPILMDIYHAEESLFLEKLINKNATSINEKSFGSLFGSLQGIFLDSIRLYICRIFENENKRYPLISIPMALIFMEENLGKLEIKDRHFLEKKLVQMGSDKEKLSQLKDVGVTEEAIKLFRNELKRSEIFDPLEKIKTIRDKAIAHHEDIEISELPRHTYVDMDSLIKLAKNFISCIGIGYLSSAYECDDGYFPSTSDAKRSSTALNRLLQKAEIILPEEGSE
jgi:hypothetical protein